MRTTRFIELCTRITQRLTDSHSLRRRGGMAMFAHGFRRFTEDVDLLVTRESMNRILAELGRPPGYVEALSGAFIASHSSIVIVASRACEPLYSPTMPAAAIASISRDARL